MSELRECPFCGEPGSSSVMTEGLAMLQSGKDYQRMCGRCGATSARRGSVEGADEEWNTRPADAVREAAREFCAIGAETNWTPFIYENDGTIDVMLTREYGDAIRALRAALAQDGRG